MSKSALQFPFRFIRFRSTNPRIVSYRRVRFGIEWRWTTAARSVRKVWSGWRTALAATRMFALPALLASDSSVMTAAAVYARPKPTLFL